ncbi:hypothetical protein [Victivallis vadensis]|uniref:hypothetical protein n=1 Tax=Victivallis vadensis TaxID=172901 RepID=UPI0023F15CEE|nr:hypothetical protein [Victivallis vadensis]
MTEPHGSGESGEWVRQYSTSRSIRAVTMAMQMSDSPASVFSGGPNLLFLSPSV